MIVAGVIQFRNNNFPSSRGFKSARYTLALYVDRDNHKLERNRTVH
jgi:hypothetical protein